MARACRSGLACPARPTGKGVFLEELEHNPAKYLPDVDQEKLGGEVVKIDLNRPMQDILATLSRHPVKTRLSLTGPMIVARDLAHSKLRERLESGQGLPDYFKNHPVYYAGPAKTPEGYASGSFGPTTAGRMDSFVHDFQAAGGSMVMLAKGNRSAAVRDACKKHGGFYLASIGGSAANLAEHCIKKVDVLEYPELGMEAIWKIDVVDFPAFIVIDDKGNDFFKELNLG
jgi:fumarate hydratase class I